MKNFLIGTVQFVVTNVIFVFGILSMAAIIGIILLGVDSSCL